MTSASVTTVPGPLLPVVNIPRAELARPLADCLLQAGFAAIEVVVRNPNALAAIERLAANADGLLVGAGTLRSVTEMERALNAGAEFLVAPGLSETMCAYASEQRVTFMPGVATVSEAMAAMQLGYSLLKFFPAEALGGVATLAAWAPVLPELRFCPTGGIRDRQLADYLRLENVALVGGSWFVDAALLAREDWAGIQAQAAAAHDLADEMVSKTTG